MSKADDSIKVIDGIICKNIDKHIQNDPGLMSQNILSQLRNLVESVSIKIFDSNDSDPENYEVIQTNLAKLRQSDKKYEFLKEFHKSLQITESHYTQDEENSERLLDNYLEYLFRLRALFKTDYGMEILNNLEKIQFINDPYSEEYYEKVALTLANHETLGTEKISGDRFYILNKKLFCIEGKIFYEITFVPVNSMISKFDRLIAYSDKEPMSNYSIIMNLVDDKINILEMDIKITIIESWMVSIRPCELKNYSKLFGEPIAIDPGLEEYRILMKYMTETRNNLLDLLKIPDKDLLNIFNTRTKRIYSILTKTRIIFNNNRPGSNIIRYLLYQLRNNVIKAQLADDQCAQLSGLYLSKKCIPFEKMPFCTSLVQHNPSLSDLIKCIDVENREHELLSRKINRISENKGSLFIELKDGCSALIDRYNRLLYLPRHENRKLMTYGKYVYTKGRVEVISQIIKRINVLNGYHFKDYCRNVQKILKEKSIDIDCEIKKTIVTNLYENNSVAFIYGSAGTGKTTLISHVSCIFSDWNKLFLANTNSAVENLRSRIKTDNSSFMTVKHYCLRPENDYQMIIIDECSTISNEDILSVLKKSKEKCLFLFVGDVYQLESIEFGNWFKIISSYVPKQITHNLETVYRTSEVITL